VTRRAHSRKSRARAGRVRAHGCTGRAHERRTRARAAVLLEVLLSLSLFAMAALAILSIVRQSIDRLDDARTRLEAADLAQTAMALIEAGVVQAAAINGVVPEGGLVGEEEADSGGIDMTPAEGPVWVLEIETERSSFDGLTRVSVTAYLEDESGGEASGVGGVGGVRSRGRVSYTLTQLVRLGEEEGG
jgi:type II secretory pathway pseudopilin PulG